MSLQAKDIQGQRICVITGKFLPTYAHVQVDEPSGQIGLNFDSAPGPCDEGRRESQIVSANQDVHSLASVHWFRPELLARIYEVKPNDQEFGLGCPLAVKEQDLTELRQLVSDYPSPQRQNPSRPG